MTKKKLIQNIGYVSVFYIMVCVTGVCFYFLDQSADLKYYGLFKDFFPIIMAVPLAYLGFCFQRRSNFHSALRLLWSNIIHAVNKAILYTEHQTEDHKEYLEILLSLSKCIDEVRGVYYNINETKTNKGYYPFESLKRIYFIIEALHKAGTDEIQLKEANESIKQHWQTIRKTFLAEFDRSEPTIADTVEA